ncbi:MAG: GNAT family N-acetyltransferase [Pseudomonadota bacterium]
MWDIRRFSELSATEVHDLYQLRAEVFVLEQRCVYQDVDGKDFEAIHVLHYDKNKSELIAYGRIFLPTQEDANARFGRIVIRKNQRGKGLAKELVQEIIRWIKGETTQPIKISAQHYLIEFYQGFGFEIMGDPYDEDGILHIDMIKPCRD